MQAREFDIILMGATGFTGQLVARYLAENHPKRKLALAGRNADKLADVRSQAKLPDATPLLVVDSFDAPALETMAQRTRVVCTTVGPYGVYGTELVRACVKHGTAYCDLTGEIPWIRSLIDTMHEDAMQSGARIVNCAGFDSVPSDVGCYVLAQQFVAQGKQLAHAHMRLVRLRGGISGGTIASGIQLAEQSNDNTVRRLLADPHALCPNDDLPRIASDIYRPRYNRDTGHFEMYFFMNATNSRIVHRTNALLNYPYGRAFTYDEVVQTGRGAKGAFIAGLGTAGLSLAAVFMRIGLSRRLLARYVLPKPGEGPSQERQRHGEFVAVFDGTATDGSKSQAHVSLDRDPGYNGTALMLSETAVCLSETNGPGGILTPISALGNALVTRLRNAGMRIYDLSKRKQAT